MKRLILCCSLFLLGVACSQEDLLTEDIHLNVKPEELVPQEISPMDIVYQESTGLWLHKKGDPYTLSNFRRIYEDVLAGRYTDLTRSEMDAVADAGELSATHYSIKFFPKTEAEQWKIERMEGVNISYYPFEYSLLNEDEVEELQITRSSANLLPEETRYIVTYDDLNTPEGPVPSEIYKLPVIYAAWPVENPLPTDLEYEIVEELYIPDGSTNVDANNVLETRVFMIPGEEVFIPVSEVTCAGYLMSFDSTLMRPVPLPNVKVHISTGSSSYSDTTRSNGYFSITGRFFLADAGISVTLQSSTWKITEGDSLYPYVFGLGRALDYWSKTEVLVPTITFKELAPFALAARTAEYYYSGNHEIPGWTYSDGLRIQTYRFKDPEGAAFGLFYSAYGGKPAYIKLYNYSYPPYSHSKKVSTLFHELGHFYHYCERGASVFNGMHDFLVESFASYVGNYLARKYYAEFGYTIDEDGSQINQSRQNWSLSIGFPLINYSPIFVDLFDSYNQYSSYYGIPFDGISNFSHEAMLRIARECSDWNSCKQILQSYVGIYYTQSTLNAQLADYNYYFSL